MWFFTKAIMSPLSEEIVRQFPSLETEIEKLRKTLDLIRDVVTGTEKDQQVRSREDRNWLLDLKDVLIDLDDLVDDVCVEAQRLKSKPKEVCFFSFNLPYTLSMNCKLKVIGKRLKFVANGADHRLSANPREEVVGSWPGHAERTHSIVGREAFKNGIVRHLLDSEVAQDVTVFPIFGTAGMGKTTLAQLVFHDDKIMKHFEPRMWVYVSDEFCLKVILERILKSATNEKRENLKMNKLMEKFQKEILAKRCLIVLEDVLKLDLKEWVDFTNLLSVAARGSSVLVTTPIEDVAKAIAKSTDLVHYTLKSLNPKESWDLFKEIAFKKEQEVEGSKLMDIGKKTVENCAGVPLAIKTVGSLLYFKNPTEWPYLMIKLAEICENENSILSTLKLCYDHLPAHLKLCFAYCALFPKDYEIDVQELINLWMAQGFITSLDQSQPLEDVGYKYFMSLVHRSFFYAIEKDELGIIRRCRMHDLLHNVANLVADMKSMLSKAFSGKIDKSILHLSFSFHFDFMHHISTVLLKGNRVLTFLLPSESQLSYREKMGDSTCYKIISCFKLLRVLDLHALGIKTLPTSVCKLKHLRYLDLSQNSIQMLPHSVTRLQNLQTLKLSDCHLLKELPKGIKKLINLRHLEIDGCWSLTHMPLGMGELTSLQTLPRFVLSEKCQSVSSRGGGLSELNKLNELKRNLEILNLEHLNDAVVDNETANMGEKKNLQELRLRWTHGSNKDEMHLDCLQPHPNLKKLYVIGFGGIKFSSWISLLTNLIEFTLFDIPNCQYLPPFDQLPYLKYLSLNSMSALEYVSAGDNILFSSTSYSSTSTAFFPSLETLTLNDLPNLKEWWKMDAIFGDSAVETPVAKHHEQHQLHKPLPSFPHLSKLSICACPKLNSMPRFPNLEELVLQNATLKPLVETVMMIDMAGPDSPKKALTTSTFSSSTLGSSSFSPLADLKSLSISRMDDLEYLPKEWLQNLTSLKKLGILFCPRLKSLPPVLQYLSSLEHLQIENCNEFDLSNDGLQWEALGSLNSLLIGEIPKLVALPEELTYVHTLTDLRIRKCSNLVALLERMDSFSSLQHLSIVECPNLVSLPEGMGKLTSLQALKISGSSLISQKCKREIGKDWPKIKHIPYVEIDYIR